MNRKFLHTNINALEISRSRFVIGVILGILYSITFYSFSYLFREILRIMPFFLSDINVWVLSDREMKFYNLIVAIFSVTFGQSVCIMYWLDRPKRVFSKGYSRIRTIVNDQRALKWAFLNWIFKVSFIYASFLSFMIFVGYNSFSFYPGYNFLFILLAVVLFLQPWNTIRLQFKNISFKWLLYSFLLVITLSIGLSRINIIDYKSLNAELLKRNIFYSYNLKLPESDIYKRIEKRSLVIDCYLVFPKNKLTDKPVLIIDNNQTDLSDLPSWIDKRKSRFSEYDVKLIQARLNIDSRIRMKYVSRLKEILANCEIYRIACTVEPRYPRYPSSYYLYRTLQIRLPDFEHGFWRFKDAYKSASNSNNPLIISNTVNDSIYLVNDSTVLYNQLEKKILQNIKTNPDLVIRFDINDSASYGSYIHVRACSKQAITELQNEYAMKIYGKEFEELDSEQVFKVERKYRLKLLEVTKDMLKKLTE